MKLTKILAVAAIGFVALYACKKEINENQIDSSINKVNGYVLQLPNLPEVVFEQSNDCDLINKITIMADEGTVYYNRTQRIGNNSEYPDYILPIDYDYLDTSEAGVIKMVYYSSENNYWFIPFDNSIPPMMIPAMQDPIKVVVHTCFCKEAPSNYAGSAYCSMESRLINNVRIPACCHKACCNCELQTNVSSGNTTIVENISGIIIKANQVIQY